MAGLGKLGKLGPGICSVCRMWLVCRVCMVVCLQVLGAPNWLAYGMPPDHAGAQATQKCL
jgi:hypothetical protein